MNTTSADITSAPETSYDDALINCLAGGKSATEAAAAIGKSVTTVYRRLRDPLLQARLAEAKAALFAPLAAKATGQIGGALDFLIGVVGDATADTRSRIQAAKTLIDTAL